MEMYEKDLLFCIIRLVLSFLAIGICAMDVPNLLGKWTGSWSAYDEGKGYSNLTENGSIIFAFLEQEDRIFARNITIKPENKTEINEGFAALLSVAFTSIPHATSEMDFAR
jgi:hypothetical protein